MTNALIDGDLPPRWGIQKEPGTDGRRVLWFGPHRIALHDIQSVSDSALTERPVDGLQLGAMAFLVIACLLAFVVYEYEWRDRYLLGTVFLGILGWVGVFEVRNIKPQSFFQISLDTAKQGTVVFASANRAEVDALLAALVSAGVAA